MSEGKRGFRTEIVVALIGMMGLLGAGVLTSWEKIFPPSENGSEVIDTGDIQLSNGGEVRPANGRSTDWIIGDPATGQLNLARGIFATRDKCMEYFVSDPASDRALGDQCMEAPDIAYCSTSYNSKSAEKRTECFVHKDSCRDAGTFWRELLDGGELEFFLDCEEMPLDEAATLK